MKKKKNLLEEVSIPLFYCFHFLLNIIFSCFFNKKKDADSHRAQFKEPVEAGGHSSDKTIELAGMTHNCYTVYNF